MHFFSQKRHRKRREKRQRRLAEDYQRQMEEEEKRPPAQHYRDGVIHVETNHPRSSIVIIRSDEGDETVKKPMRESSFQMTHFESSNTKHKDENENDVSGGVQDTVNVQVEFNKRTEYIDYEGDQLIEHTVDEKGDYDSSRSQVNSRQRAKTNTKSAKSSKRRIPKDSTNSVVMTDAQNTEPESKKSATNRSASSGRKSNNGHHDNTADDTDSDDDSSDPGVYESCLRQIYPEPFAQKYEK